MSPETAADGQRCPALAWLPAATLRRLSALEDGAYVVVNPHVCMLLTGHTGDHLALVQFAGETGHWATWTIPAGPVSVEAAEFCPACLPATDAGDNLYCHLPIGHNGPHGPVPAGGATG
ncbi:hypothetical protein ACG83_30145 [Frankia sp. R43]|uniref:hypothetical protein n=1 Tax=Frankia sp. R43 TaxID=269536 RepID=UPI0006CA1FB0|nr:hypothetical protein [Frankia sp. R43]KPM52564.1 hypothetical protein ACG83_30145 [Frankia sp. R43]